MDADSRLSRWRRTRWRDLSPRQRAAFTALGAVELALAAAAWTDLARRPSEDVHGSKGVWALVIGINVIGPLAYFRYGRRSPQ
ncbi:PLDc N-terminal domain-containing protein [Saccharomonospora sp. NPDC046836]|uniref:PLDc N-terminal domain-containing protein n=1 Tax=Saccharomonospora sp. NPDC046836 TaxID=3156921 RepID=UPI0033EFE6D2